MTGSFGKLFALTSAVAIVVAGLSGPAAAQDTLRVSISPTAPYGQEPGFFSELLTAIGERAGFAVEFEVMPFGQVFTAVVENNVDVGAGGGPDTPANRERGLVFSPPVALVTGAFVVQATSLAAYAAITDLQDVAVGVTAPSPWANVLAEAGLTNVTEFASFADAMAALEAGDIEAYFTNPAVFSNHREVQGLHQWARVAETYTNPDFAPLAIAVRADETDLLETINSAIAELVGDGTLAALGAEWHVGIPD